MGIMTFEGENNACLHKIIVGLAYLQHSTDLNETKVNLITNYQVATSRASPHFTGTVSLDGILNILSISLFILKHVYISINMGYMRKKNSSSPVLFNQIHYFNNYSFINI